MLAELARKAEVGFDTFGTPHAMLRVWHREVWPAGPPRHGRPLRVRVPLPSPFTIEELRALGGVDRLGLQIAEAETRLILDESAATNARSTRKDLDQSVRSAIRHCLGVSENAGIWMNFADEAHIAGESSRPWDGVSKEPAYAYWGEWHRVPVFQTNFIGPGDFWVLGDRSTRLSVYPDQDGAGRLSLFFDRATSPQHLEARLWIELSARDPRALHRITLIRDDVP